MMITSSDDSSASDHHVLLAHTKACRPLVLTHTPGRAQLL
eukprot:SAG11_NODE_11607_length_749_cov_1.649231_1_plen_39_part_01